MPQRRNLSVQGLVLRGQSLFPMGSSIIRMLHNSFMIMNNSLFTATNEYADAFKIGGEDHCFLRAILSEHPSIIKYNITAAMIIPENCAITVGSRYVMTNSISSVPKYIC